MIKEKNDLNERLGLQCDHLETLQKEIQTINENHLFEKEEFANDKAVCFVTIIYLQFCIFAFITIA